MRKLIRTCTDIIWIFDSIDRRIRGHDGRLNIRMNNKHASVTRASVRSNKVIYYVKHRRLLFY